MKRQDENEEGDEAGGRYEKAHGDDLRTGVLRHGVGSVRKGKGVPVDEEREVQHDPQVLEGEDDLPRQPTAQRDPFVPEPAPRPGERRAWRVMRLAWLPIVVVVAVVLWAALR